MISKMNKDKHGALQQRLSDANNSIKNLSKLHDVIALKQPDRQARQAAILRRPAQDHQHGI